MNFGTLLAALKVSLEWCDGRILKDEFDRQILALLGPRNDEDATKVSIRKIYTIYLDIRFFHY